MNKSIFPALLASYATMMIACSSENGTSGNPDAYSSETVHESSSSATEESSSSSTEASSEEFSLPKVTIESFIDARDNQKYNSAKINNQFWMIQNLNYDYSEVPGTSFCYEKSQENCDQFGRLYTWAAAMDSAAVFTTDAEGCGRTTADDPCTKKANVRGICPEDWHIPTVAEWDTLIAAVGGLSNAGKILKAKNTWISGGEGIDAISFSIYPTGYRDSAEKFYGQKKQAQFWTSDEQNGTYAYQASFTGFSDNATLDYAIKAQGSAIRCVRNF